MELKAVVNQMELVLGGVDLGEMVSFRGKMELSKITR